MHRGKIIGAIVLVGAIGLIIAERVGEQDNGQAGSAPQQSAPSNAARQNSAAEAAGLPASGEVRIYTIDAAQSEVFWRIYKAGAMARLGHNHVISVNDLAGSVTLRSDPAAAEWNLSFPVAALAVDDASLRSRFGADFESIPTDTDKAGTKDNMLKPEVLNGDAFAEVRLEGRGFEGPLQNAELPVQIYLLGRTIEQRFPAAIMLAGDRLTVTGEYRLTHDDLGMTPFTALGGLMSVGNEIDFTYTLHAVAGGQ